MSYKVLTFEPRKDDKQHNPILWKAQMFPPEGYVSIGTTLLQDNIEVNNRRTCEEWEKLLTENGFKFEFNYDHEFCKEYIIFDSYLVSFSFQIFSCDLAASNYKVEVADKFIIPVLYCLDLQKEGSIFPQAIINRIKRFREGFDGNIETNKSLSFILSNIEKIAEACQLYEVDLLYSIEDK
jgi:hypothetical protein